MIRNASANGSFEDINVEMSDYIAPKDQYDDDHEYNQPYTPRHDFVDEYDYTGQALYEVPPDASREEMAEAMSRLLQQNAELRKRFDNKQ